MRNASRRRPPRDGPLLALVVFAGLALVAGLALGAFAGIEECGYALFLLLGLVAIAGRAELAELNRRAWTSVFGGTGARIVPVARAVWLAWGALTTAACVIALLTSAFRAAT
jgi:hypothetical protein